MVLVVKPEGNRTFGRPGCKWGDNMIMDLQEVGWVCMDWINLAQYWNRWRAFVNEVMNLGVPWFFPYFFLSCKANASVKPAKKGHGPRSSKIFVLFYVLFVLCRSVYCLCVNVYCTAATGWLPNCS